MGLLYYVSYVSSVLGHGDPTNGPTLHVPGLKCMSQDIPGWSHMVCSMSEVSQGCSYMGYYVSLV